MGLGIAAAPAVSAAAAEIEVDLELVLAVDISRSVDDQEAKLQRDGYIAAISNPRVLQAIQSGPNRAIALCYIEWAQYDQQFIVVNWTLINNEGSAAAFAAALAGAERVSLNWTSISGAIDFSSGMFDGNGYAGLRRVIDVSGDGRNNSGRPAAFARDDAVAKDITINGLPIINDRNNFGRPPEIDLADYYEKNVVGGPGSFMVIAENFEAFSQAVLNKFIREIVDLEGPKRIWVGVDGTALAERR